MKIVDTCIHYVIKIQSVFFLFLTKGLNECHCRPLFEHSYNNSILCFPMWMLTYNFIFGCSSYINFALEL